MGEGFVKAVMDIGMGMGMEFMAPDDDFIKTIGWSFPHHYEEQAAQYKLKVCHYHFPGGLYPLDKR